MVLYIYLHLSNKLY